MEAIATAEERVAAPAPVRGLPPGPRMGRPLQTLIWSRRAQWMLEQCRVRLGPMFTLNIAYEGTWVVITDPEDVKAVFTGDPAVFHAGEGNRVLKPVLGESSLLTLDEDAHMRQRKLLLPPFHGARMQGYEEKMREIAAREIESWPLGVPHRLRPRMQAITLEIILETVFGVHGGARTDELREALRDLLDLTTNPRLLAPLLLAGPGRAHRIRSFRRRIDRVDRLLYEEIAERRAAEDVSEREDILSMLVAARDEDGRPMTDVEMRDELITLLVAGHETTATALSWAVERLVRHPRKLERLRAEALAGDDAYLTATIQETLRLRPVIVLVARHLTEPVELGGYELPAGVTVTPSIHLIHRDPRIYPEPGRFLPERFLEEPRAPTPGSRSAAACVAAWAPPSPSSRWPSSCASSSPGAGCCPSGPSRSVPSAGRSPRPRATTRRSSSADGPARRKREVAGRLGSRASGSVGWASAHLGDQRPRHRDRGPAIPEAVQADLVGAPVESPEREGVAGVEVVGDPASLGQRHLDPRHLQAPQDANPRPRDQARVAGVGGDQPMTVVVAIPGRLRRIEAGEDRSDEVEHVFAIVGHGREVAARAAVLRARLTPRHQRWAEDGPLAQPAGGALAVAPHHRRDPPGQKRAVALLRPRGLSAAASGDQHESGPCEEPRGRVCAGAMSAADLPCGHRLAMGARPAEPQRESVLAGPDDQPDRPPALHADPPRPDRAGLG